jgi:hypothetical protein
MPGAREIRFEVIDRPSDRHGTELPPVLVGQRRREQQAARIVVRLEPDMLDVRIRDAGDQMFERVVELGTVRVGDRPTIDIVDVDIDVRLDRVSSMWSMTERRWSRSAWLSDVSSARPMMRISRVAAVRRSSRSLRYATTAYIPNRITPTAVSARVKRRRIDIERTAASGGAKLCSGEATRLPGLQA